MKAKTNDKNLQVYSHKKYHTQRQRNTSLQTAFAQSPQPLTHCPQNGDPLGG